MKIAQAKIVLISLLVFVTLCVIFLLGLWPWWQRGHTDNQTEHTRNIFVAASPTFELGTLTEDPYYLKEPMARVLRQTAAKYLAVYNIKGMTIAVEPQDKSLAPLSEDFIRSVLKQAGPAVVENQGLTDLYVPIWSRRPIGDSMDESNIFFPKEENTKEEAAKTRSQILGIARLGISPGFQHVMAPPAGKDRLYMVLALSCGALLLYFSFWWALHKRYQPIHLGVRRLSQGNYGYRIPRQGAAELRYLAEDINLLAQRLDQLNGKMSEIASDTRLADKQVWLEGLATKLADELASPAGFLYMNLYKLLEYITNLLQVVHAYGGMKLHSQDAQELEELKQDTEFEHIIEDVERLVRSCIKAIDKIKKVSADLKNLASSQEAEQPKAP